MSRKIFFSSLYMFIASYQHIVYECRDVGTVEQSIGGHGGRKNGKGRERQRKKRRARDDEITVTTTGIPRESVTSHAASLSWTSAKRRDRTKAHWDHSALVSAGGHRQKGELIISM